MLIAVALYAFLGVVLLVLLREQRPAGQGQSDAALVRLGTDGSPLQGSGSSYPLALHSPTWIGRDPNCAIRINNEFVSQRHAKVEWREDKRAWWVEDNDSRNGTTLNGERVMRGELKDDDIIVIGGVQFRFAMDGQGTTQSQSPITNPLITRSQQEQHHRDEEVR